LSSYPVEEASLISLKKSKTKEAGAPSDLTGKGKRKGGHRPHRKVVANKERNMPRGRKESRKALSDSSTSIRSQKKDYDLPWRRPSPNPSPLSDQLRALTIRDKDAVLSAP